ncbi:MAG: hypothetical protein AAF170_18845 [Bacteroidota bacterium]
MSLRPLALLALLSPLTACAQDAPSPEPLAQVAPEVPAWYAPPTTAKVWAQELHSPDGWTGTPTFSRDLRTVYYVRWDDPDYNDLSSIQELFSARWDDAAGVWTSPERVEMTAGWRVDWPHVSPDGARLFLSTNRPHAGHSSDTFRGRPVSDFDLWTVDLRPDGSLDSTTFQPLRGPDLNRQKTREVATIGYTHNETGPSTDLDGRLYFWTERLDDGGGRRDVYLAEPDGAGSYLEPVLLPFNTQRRESGVAADPRGQWLIVASEGLRGAGRSDLFLVVREGDGWSQPVNLGPAVNTEHDESSPDVTADGRTLFFTTDRPVEGVPIVDAGEGAGPASTMHWVDLTSLPAFQRATSPE